MSGYPHTGCRDRAKEWYRSYTRIEAYLTGYTHPFRIVAYRKLFCDAGIGCRRDRIPEETFRD